MLLLIGTALKILHIERHLQTRETVSCEKTYKLDCAMTSRTFVIWIPVALLYQAICGADRISPQDGTQFEGS